ncbi:MAG: HD domain-containing protein [Deltaproteobacteria bacterium]|nr:HD domain-containing protein [Deltaproteobacteria bacterium]
MEDNRLRNQVQFILEVDNLKNVIRRSYLIDAHRKENSAEHSWHVALMVLVFAEYADQPLNSARVIKLLLVHDIVETDAGDTYCYDSNATHNKSEREQKAAQRLFGLLPPDQASRLQELWIEFEARITPESKFARALDCLMPLLHNYYTKGKSWKEHGITADQVIDHTKVIGDISRPLWDFARSTIDDAVAKGYLGKHRALSNPAP